MWLSFGWHGRWVCVHSKDAVCLFPLLWLWFASISVKMTTNYIVDTNLDIFHSFACFWKKMCLSQDSFLPSIRWRLLLGHYDTKIVAAVYSVQSQNQICQNLSCALVSQRKIENLAGIWVVVYTVIVMWRTTRELELAKNRIRW